ncbi:MAG TPA: SEC-C metal-binding domain-containing protein, partial [Candidatus Limnocylindrales bacterium]
YDGLEKALAAFGLDTPGFGADALAAIGVRDEIVEHLQAEIDEALEEREQRYGADVWAQVERFVLLRSIDTLWVDHLTELDDLRRGIGLRGYGGIDPLNEFKKEAYRLYEELRGFIGQQVASTIFRVNVQPAAQPLTETSAGPVGATASAVSGNGDGARAGALAGATAAAGGTPALVGMAAGAARRGIQYQHGDQPAAEADGRAAGSRGAAGTRGAAAGGAQSPDGRKLGRNDPCWCGSGKKFKRCHGA